MKTNHTPGPWRIMQGIASGIITSESGPIVNGDGCAPMERGQDEIDANTRLIAAAPDLLAACKLALRLYPDAHQHQEGAKCWACETQKAIDNAEGKC